MGLNLLQVNRHFIFMPFISRNVILSHRMFTNDVFTKMVDSVLDALTTLSFCRHSTFYRCSSWSKSETYNLSQMRCNSSLYKGCIAFNIRVVRSCLKFREKSKGKV